MSDATPGPHTPLDPRRLAALREYDLLDAAPDPALERLAARAGRVLGASSAAVAIVDADREWLRAAVGTEVRDSPLDRSLCVATIAEPDGLLVIPDTHADPRFVTHRAVAAPSGVRFYAGASLETPTGERLGALCVFDTVPRQPTAEQVRELQQLADEVMLRLALDKERARRAVVEQRLAEAQRMAEFGSWELDLATGRLWWSDEVFRQFGIAPSEFGATYEAFVATVHPDDRSALEAAQARALAGEVPLDVVHRIVRPDGTERVVHERGDSHDQ